MPPPELEPEDWHHSGPKQDPGPGNGGTGPNYSWTQTLSEVMIVLPVDRTILVKEVCMSLSRHMGPKRYENLDGQLLRFGLRHQPAMIDGHLFSKVFHKAWQLDREEGTIEVSLEKDIKTEWWPCIIKGHPEIDLTQVKPEDTRLEDLDPEIQSMVERIRHDNVMIGRGQPTSVERDKKAMLNMFREQHPELDFTDAQIQ